MRRWPWRGSQRALACESMGLSGEERASAERDWRLDGALSLCVSGIRVIGRELEIIVGHVA
eukprot:2446333-Lingulodinium_polyedra.AAC.1